jgi:hypothetical protein
MWDAWVAGRLEFPRRGVERWKKTALDPRAVFPPWLAPPRSAVFDVGDVLADVTLWTPAWKTTVYSSTRVDVRATTDAVSIAAYLTTLWCSHFAGSLAAIAHAARGAGAVGEVFFVERASGRGHRLALDGRGPGGFEALELGRRAPAAVHRAYETARAQCAALPDLDARDDPSRAREAGRDDEWRPPCPFEAIHRERGGALDPEDPFALPARYRDRSVDADVARVTGSYGIFDLSMRACIEVGMAPGFAFVQAQGGGSIADVPVSRATEGALVDAHGLVDRVVVKRPLPGVTGVYGSAGNATCLLAYLRALKKAGRNPHGKLVKVWAPLFYGATTLVWAGPGAAEALARAWGLRALPALEVGGTLNPAPDPIGGAITRRVIGGLDAWEVEANDAALRAILARDAESLVGMGALERLVGARERPVVSPTRRPRFE